MLVLIFVTKCKHLARKQCNYMLYVNFIACLNGLLLLFIIYRMSTKEKWILPMKHSKIILCGIVYVCFKKCIFLDPPLDTLNQKYRLCSPWVHKYTIDWKHHALLLTSIVFIIQNFSLEWAQPFTVNLFVKIIECLKKERLRK